MVIDLKITDALSEDSVRKLLASASGRQRTQLRVSKDGVVSICATEGSMLPAEASLFVLEPWEPGTDYVGPGAAADHSWVSRILAVLRNNWPAPASSYIDVF